MHIPGHLAFALLEHRLLTVYLPDRKFAVPLFIATFFPDAVDKTIGYIFQWMPNGRHYSHNLFSLALLTGLVSLMGGKTAGIGWFVGHFGHMLIDIRNSKNFVPWLFPLKWYTFYPGKLRLRPRRFLKESLLLAGVILFLRLTR